MKIHIHVFLLPVGLLVATTAHAQTVAPAPTPGTATGGTPAAPARPQPAPRPFLTVGGFSFSGYLRSRYENLNYFNAPGFNDSYGFTGSQLRLAAVRSTPKLDIQFDLQGTLLTGIPNDAVAPAPQGALGVGGNYYAANGGQDGSVYVRQAFVRSKGLFGTGSSARVGRFEYNDGLEIASKNPTLTWLKTQRIAQRLVGVFAYTHTGRAFDGGQLSLPVGKTGNFTTVVARPTTGVFSVKSNDNVDGTGFVYGALSNSKPTADMRFFGMAYQDVRPAPKSVKVDNRPLAARQVDTNAIRVYTVGANYEKTLDSKSGTIDLLAWGALQGGEWGRLRQRANAFALEAGYQPKGSKLRPWLRAGFYRASGDGNPNDRNHGTFFTPVTTPRLYARFPFYNQMNSQDAFAQLILRPNPKTNLRFEAHNLRLASSRDLWYQGGGAFTDGGFGFTGRPSNGNSSLGNLLDASFDYTIDPQTSVGLYYGYALGGKVIDAIYPSGGNATFGFVELTRRF
ncbi:hypothetical protein IAD21_01050 [Abditibacteriota bacterium]|nr:hypothetical protein IAD21_01050 [Abditibacteriota bacterium]